MTEVNFPSKEDKLFKDFNLDYTKNAIITSGEEGFKLYSEGYKRAAIKLWEGCSGNAGDANSMVYPLMFLSRQFIELRLKEVIGVINVVLINEFKFSKDHSLVNLWNEYKQKLKQLGDDYSPSKKDITIVGRLIKEFNTLDPDCYTRYPFDKKMNPTLQIKSLDIENFMMTMEKLLNFFDAAWDQVYCLKDQNEDFNRAMEQAFGGYAD